MLSLTPSRKGPTSWCCRSWPPPAICSPMLTKPARWRCAPTDPAFDAWRSAAGDAIVIGGFCELGDDGLLYNSAIALDRDGLIATYRKTHLWDREKLIFTRGAALPPVLKTRHGAIAVMVCYDLEFGEVTRQVAVDGVELIAAPVNWPLFPRPEGERPGEVITAMSTARLNRVVVAVCDRAGVERGQPWTQGSVIVDPRRLGGRRCRVGTGGAGHRRRRPDRHARQDSDGVCRPALRSAPRPLLKKSRPKKVCLSSMLPSLDPQRLSSKVAFRHYGVRR